MHRPQCQNEEVRGQAVFGIVKYAPQNPYAELLNMIHPQVPECWGEGGEEEVGVSAQSTALEREPAWLNELQIQILST